MIALDLEAIGRPGSSKPQGIDIAGAPVRLLGDGGNVVQVDLDRIVALFSTRNAAVGDVGPSYEPVGSSGRRGGNRRRSPQLVTRCAFR